MVGALASVTAGLVVLALAILGLTRMRNQGAAEQRATTRALWTATAVNAASSLLRRGPEVRAEAAPTGESSGSHRSALLIGGGLVLILLGILFPSGTETASRGGRDGRRAGAGRRGLTAVGRQALPGRLALAPLGLSHYRPRILKRRAAAGLPDGLLFSFQGKTGGANRKACEKTRKGN